jgi:antitoxin component HigA of HigAB toxin-antitoxin module
MNLQEWMSEKNLNDAALAAKVDGVSRSQISRIRRRRSIPTTATAKKLEAVTGIPAEALVFAERVKA